MAERFLTKVGRYTVAIFAMAAMSALLKLSGFWADIPLSQLMAMGVYFIAGWNLTEWAGR